MPEHPGLHLFNPDEFAKQVAAQLATSPPPRRRFSLRDSIIVGRILYGSMVLVAVVAVGGTGWIGIGWLADRANGDPEVLAVSASAGDLISSTGPTSLSTSPLLTDGPFTPTTFGWLGVGLPGEGSLLPSIPPPTRTNTLPGASPTPTAPIGGPTTSTAPASSTSSPAPPDTLPPQTTTSTTLMVTTTPPTSTTTLPPTTTTTYASTTTTMTSTTTTCEIGGGSQGNCG